MLVACGLLVGLVIGSACSDSKRPGPERDGPQSDAPVEVDAPVEE